MRFYDREQEIDFLQETRETEKKVARFTVVTGRRRIGKTTLVREAYKDQPFIYFFVARKAESELCEVYLEEISEKLGIPTLGSSRHFSDIFRYLMELSVTQSFTLVIDEFHDFFRVNKAVFSEMQDIWDKYEITSHVNLIVCGSIYTLM
jgi:AAA+ ATPase superfamily predicted ATPase